MQFRFFYHLMITTTFTKYDHIGRTKLLLRIFERFISNRAKQLSFFKYEEILTFVTFSLQKRVMYQSDSRESLKWIE